MPGVQDVWPGDAIAIALPRQSLQVSATVREVKIQFLSVGEECSQYTIEFANDAAQQLSFSLGTTTQKIPLSTSTEIAGTSVPCLPDAEITSVQATSLVIDAGMAPVAGGGFEVRLKDEGWGANVDRNLLGRFTTETLPCQSYRRRRTTSCGCSTVQLRRIIRDLPLSCMWTTRAVRKLTYPHHHCREMLPAALADTPFANLVNHDAI